MRARSLPVRVLIVAAVSLTGCSSTGSGEAVTPAAVAVTPSESAVPSDGPTLTAASRATWTPTPSPTAPATTPPPSAPPAPSYDVAAVQRQLTELRYYAGPIDGKAGAALRSAVMAFQKVQGIGADGVVGGGTLAALAAPQAPQLRASAPGNRVEVDLTKQVLYVVKGGSLIRILPVSSGNGATYKQKNGSTARALTPTGWYKIERRIVGERHADLGVLYDPQYFYRGWAIHGSNSVPPGPASHGCVRVTRWDAKWLLGEIGVGWSVHLYGGTHTFTAGSSAPGTDSPTGDGGGQAAPPAPAEPAPAPPPPATEEPSPTPTPTQEPTPTPTSPETTLPAP